MADSILSETSQHVVIEVWTDLGCPWCYVGKHRLQEAIADRPDSDRFVLRLRSFELNPGAPKTPETIESAFIRSHGGDAQVVVQAERRIQALAQSEGLAFSVDRLNANTFDFHRVFQYAQEQGVGVEFFSLMQDRFFAGELNPSRPTLSRRPVSRWGFPKIEYARCWRGTTTRRTSAPTSKRVSAWVFGGSRSPCSIAAWPPRVPSPSTDTPARSRSPSLRLRRVRHERRIRPAVRSAVGRRRRGGVLRPGIRRRVRHPRSHVTAPR